MPEPARMSQQRSMTIATAQHPAINERKPNKSTNAVMNSTTEPAFIDVDADHVTVVHNRKNVAPPPNTPYSAWEDKLNQNAARSEATLKSAFYTKKHELGKPKVLKVAPKEINTTPATDVTPNPTHNTRAARTSSSRPIITSPENTRRRSAPKYARGSTSSTTKRKLPKRPEVFINGVVAIDGDALLEERDVLLQQLEVWDDKCVSLSAQLEQLQAMREKNRGQRGDLASQATDIIAAHKAESKRYSDRVDVLSKELSASHTTEQQLRQRITELRSKTTTQHTPTTNEALRAQKAAFVAEMVAMSKQNKLLHEVYQRKALENQQLRQQLLQKSLNSTTNSTLTAVNEESVNVENNVPSSDITPAKTPTSPTAVTNDDDEPTPSATSPTNNRMSEIRTTLADLKLSLARKPATVTPSCQRCQHLLKQQEQYEADADMSKQLHTLLQDRVDGFEDYLTRDHVQLWSAIDALELTLQSGFDSAVKTQVVVMQRHQARRMVELSAEEGEFLQLLDRGDISEGMAQWWSVSRDNGGFGLIPAKSLQVVDQQTSLHILFKSIQQIVRQVRDSLQCGPTVTELTKLRMGITKLQLILDPHAMDTMNTTTTMKDDTTINNDSNNDKIATNNTNNANNANSNTDNNVSINTDNDNTSNNHSNSNSYNDSDINNININGDNDNINNNNNHNNHNPPDHNTTRPSWKDIATDVTSLQSSAQQLIQLMSTRTSKSFADQISKLADGYAKLMASHTLMLEQVNQMTVKQAQDLPHGWETAVEPESSFVYFVNHVTRETTWIDPRTGNSAQPTQQPSARHAMGAQIQALQQQVNGLKDSTSMI